MIELLTKPGCPFCITFIEALNDMGIDYVTAPVRNGHAPQLWIDGKRIFNGLPKKRVLYDYFNARKTNADSSTSQ